MTKGLAGRFSTVVMPAWFRYRVRVIHVCHHRDRSAKKVGRSDSANPKALRYRFGP